MAFIKPDKIVTTSSGLIIKQKIIPDSLRATKNVASWCKSGVKMKPCAKLNNGVGKDAMLHYLSAQASYYNDLIQNHQSWQFAGVYYTKQLPEQMNRVKIFSVCLEIVVTG